MFRKLKKRFIKEPVLAALDLDKKNEDRSGCIRLCNGYVLLIECEDGKPVAYLSKLLNEMKRNYEIHDKEMLVIIKSL